MNDLLQMLDNLKEFGDQFDIEKFYMAAVSNAKMFATQFAKDALLNKAEQSIEATEEYARYEPLRDRLIENLQRPEHYRVSDDLSSMVILDETVAGTLEDFKRGQEAAWRSAGGTPKQRLFAWTYGIYKPFAEGFIFKPLQKRDKFGRFKKRAKNPFEDYPSYEAIVEKRLEAWGDAAPYWYFINYGTAGAGEAYPTFGGTGFVEEVRNQAPDFLQRASALAAEELEAAIAAAIEEQLSRPERLVKVYIYSRPMKSGETYYQLNIAGRGWGKRVFPGQYVAELGGVFNP